MIPDIESFRLVPHKTNIIKCLKILKFPTIHMGMAQKWNFSTLGGAANLGGVFGDLSEHRGRGIPLLGITSLNRHFYVQIDWTVDLRTICERVFFAI